MNGLSGTLDALKCECCGGELVIACAKKKCKDPLEQRRKSKGPVPGIRVPPPRRTTCNVRSCDDPVVPYSGHGRPPAKCEKHWNPVSKRGKR